MSFAPYQAPNQSYLDVQNEADPLANSTSDLWHMEPPVYRQPVYLPSVAAPSVASPIYEARLVNPSGEGVGYDPYRTTPYSYTLRDYPEIAAGPAEVLPGNSDASRIKETSGMLVNDFPIPEADSINPSMVYTTPPVNIASVPMSPSEAPSITSSSGKRRARRYCCVECGASFDRVSRARDHAFQDLGQTPYTCGSSCGERNCNKAYSSEKLLKEHLDKDRLISCPQCGRRLCKKNLARHKWEACY